MNVGKECASERNPLNLQSDWFRQRAEVFNLARKPEWIVTRPGPWLFFFFFFFFVAEKEMLFPGLGRCVLGETAPSVLNTATWRLHIELTVLFFAKIRVVI